MEPICGIPGGDLARGGAMYATLAGLDHLLGHGHQPARPRHRQRALPDRAGADHRPGRPPGTGLHPLRGQNNVQGASDAGLIPMFLPDYQPVGAPICASRSKALGHELDPKRGLTVVEIMNAIHAGQITACMSRAKTRRCRTRSAARPRQALAKLEHLVVQDLFVTETAFHADVILPASAFAEKSGTFTNTDRRVQLAREVIKPPGDARQDLVDHPGNRQAHGAGLELSGPAMSSPRWRRPCRR
jgi:formate dehydrogenase major subunit